MIERHGRSPHRRRRTAAATAFVAIAGLHGLALASWAGVAPRVGFVQKLTGSATGGDDLFGFRPSIAGATAIVGAPGHDPDSGAAFVFVRDGGSWSEVAALEPSDRPAGARFGWGTAISGDVAVIGAPGASDARGAAYVFRRTGGEWVEETKLVATDAAGGALFGWTVAVAGDTVLVGAPGADGDRGAVYVFSAGNGSWVAGPKLTDAEAHGLGWSAAIAGDTIIAGAPSTGDGEGSALVFARSGGTWALQERLAGDANDLGDKAFGISVALSGTTAVVGAEEEDTVAHDSGAAYVFVRADGAWRRQAKLVPAEASTEAHFGLLVAVSGDAAVVGAPLDSVDEDTAGAAYLFVRTGDTWTERARLGADSGEEDEFGHVAISGATAIVGAPSNDSFGEDAGAAYAYDLTDLVAARQSAVELTPDGRRILISKDVAGPSGPERWAITRDLDDETVTGNVFPADGGAPTFIFCTRTASDAAEITLHCSASTGCAAAACSGARWSDLGTVRVPAAFLAPPVETAARTAR